MIDEETRRLRAYQIWESEGRPDGQDLAHWYKAGDDGAADAKDRPNYLPYLPGTAPVGSLVIKFYHSGDQTRGYVRKVAETASDDAIFPGEEMEPEAAFKLASSHNGESGKPIFVELAEGVEWQPSWGYLGLEGFEGSQPENDDGRSSDAPLAKRRRSNPTRGARQGLQSTATKATAEGDAPAVKETNHGKK